jgi:ribonuclease HII
MDNFTMRKNKKLNFNKNYYENAAWQDQSFVCGIDEVGRGCLAGPLVTAAVILPIGKVSRLIKDSKVMTPEEREKAAKWIKKHCKYAIGIVHNRLIDKHNIWHADLIAMKKALVNLLALCPQLPSAILVDAMPLQLADTNYKDIPVHYFPFGESKSSSIAAASIIAKVTRDALMASFDPLFPGYKLKSHKGYSTKEHKSLVREHTHTIIHRMSFLARIGYDANDKHKQQTINEEIDSSESQQTIAYTAMDEQQTLEVILHTEIVKTNEHPVINEASDGNQKQTLC